METFNPYLKWLGIPLKHQPPNHYRLLGVEQFEADADIIERTADRQMTYLRSLQSGENGKAAQQLLNEISSAKVCLLDAKRKSEYDERLRQSMPEVAAPPAARSFNGSGIHESGGGVAVAAPPAAKAPPPRTTAPGSSGLQLSVPMSGPSQSGIGGARAPAMAGASAAGTAGQSSARSKSPFPLVLVAAAAGGFLLLLLAIAALVFSSRGGANNVAEIDDPIVDSATDTGNDVHNNDQNPPPPVIGNTVGNTNTGNGSSTNNGTTQTPVPPKGTETGSTDNDPPPVVDDETGSEPKAPQPAIVEIDAPFIPGTLADGETVLSDREITFANVSAELQGLDFTRWQYGRVAPFKVKLQRSGDVYLILPPNRYEQPVPKIRVPGWELTELHCEVSVEGGLLPCHVFRLESPPSGSASPGEFTVPTNATIWPILAVNKIRKPTGSIGEVVIGGNPPNETPVTIPPRQGDDEDPRPVGETVTNPPTTTPQVANAKLKVPTSDLQKPVREKLAQLYDLDSLKTADDKLRVARNLLDAAREPSDKPEERYVMLATSAQLAADAGELLAALMAVETLAADFDGDVSAMKLHLARLFAKSSVTVNVKAQQLDQVLAIIDEGMASDHFDAIDDLVKELLAAKLKHPELAGRRKIALDMSETYRKVVSAQKVLAVTPDDPVANRTVGEYYCYYKLDWEQGLPYLVKADDGALKEAANRDAASPEASSDQLAVADGWFDIAKAIESKTAERQKSALLTRSQQWYEKAIVDAQGLDEAHAKKRIDEAQLELEKLGWIDIPREATISAAAGYSFDCYLNGEQLFSSYNGVSSQTATLKRGDLLMFRASKGSGSFGSYGKGFACVITYNGAKPVATGLSQGWEGFVPSNQSTWYRPSGIARAVPILISQGSGHQDLAAQTGVAARSVWYAAGNSYEAYFVYRVR